MLFPTTSSPTDSRFFSRLLREFSVLALFAGLVSCADPEGVGPGSPVASADANQDGSAQDGAAGNDAEVLFEQELITGVDCFPSFQPPISVEALSQGITVRFQDAQWSFEISGNGEEPSEEEPAKMPLNLAGSQGKIITLHWNGHAFTNVSPIPSPNIFGEVEIRSYDPAAGTLELEFFSGQLQDYVSSDWCSVHGVIKIHGYGSQESGS